MSKIIIPTAAILTPPAAAGWGGYDGSKDGAIYNATVDSPHGMTFEFVNGFLGLFTNDAATGFNIASMSYSGKTISAIGSATLLNAQTAGIVIDKLFKMGTDILGIFYNDGNNHLAYGQMLQFDNSGVITAGTALNITWNGNVVYRNGAALDSSNFIYSDYQNRFQTPTNVIATASISGTTITLGSYSYPTANYEGGNTNKNVCALTSSLGLMGWGSYGSNTVKVVAATISGGAPTAGDALDTTLPITNFGGDSGNPAAYTLCFAQIDSANAVAVSGGGQACVLNVSGTTITANTPATFDSNCLVVGKAHLVDSFIIIPYLDTSYHLQIAVGSISGNTITFNAPVDTGILSNSSYPWVDSALIDNTHIAVGTIKSTGKPSFKIISDS